ncbi:MAG: GWxTD domain-containing protein, partial [Edaphobacter sp.]
MALLFLLAMGVRTLPAQDANSGAQLPDGVTQGPATVEKPDPLKRTLTDKEKIAQQKALRGELHGVYKKWVDEDVRWIITDTEMQAFKNLGNDEERDQFIENFWLRR